MAPRIAPIVPFAPLQPSEEILRQTLDVLINDGVIAFPTDTLYGRACAFGATMGIERIQAMRKFNIATRPLTFILPDLGELPRYSQVGEASFRVLMKIFPGPYCAELIPNKSVPAPFMHEDRRTFGVRIPASPLCRALGWGLGKPLLSASAKSRSGEVLTTAMEIQQEYGRELDLILDGGTLSGPPSTLVSLAGDWITVLREGRGPSNKLIG